MNSPGGLGHVVRVVVLRPLVEIYRQYRRRFVGDWIGEEKNHYRK